MPVTKSAKKALFVAKRRHLENLVIKDLYKKAVKAVRKAVSAGAEDAAALMSEAQSQLDRAAKKNTIHRNKAARLKSRLAKNTTVAAAPKKATKKAAPKKTTAKAKKK
jgi:small subunit ribosomal protein S20